MSYLKQANSGHDFSHGKKTFTLPDLDDPIVPVTRENVGVAALGGTLIAIAVLIATQG